MKKSFSLLLALLLILSAVGIPASFAEEPVGSPLLSESFEADFSLRPAGWTGNCVSSRETAYHSDGAASFRMADNSTSGSCYLASPVLDLRQDVYYRVSVDVYNITGNGSVFVQFRNSSGTVTDSVSSTVTVTGKWTTVNFSVKLPENAVNAVILLYSGLANKGETCFDRVIVTEETGSDTQEIHDFSLLCTDYPRLFATGTELETLRERSTSTEQGIAGYTGASCREELLRSADELLNKTSFSMTYYSSKTIVFTIPFTEKHITEAPSGYSGSNYPYWQEMGNRMMEMMQTLALAYALTGNASYGNRAVALADSLASWSTWTEYPTVNRTSLETGYFVNGVCTVYDLCFDLMDAATRTRLETAMEERGLKPLFADLSAFTDHNYYVNKASALMTGALLLSGKCADAPKYLSRAYDFLSWYLDCRYDSESQEGLSYTSYSMDLIYGALDQLRRVTGDTSLLGHPYTDVVFRWAVMASENQNGTGAKISDQYSDTYFFVTANAMQKTDCAGLARWYLSTRSFADVSAFQRLIRFRIPEAGETVETPDAYFARTGFDLQNGVIDRVGWGALRTGWKADDMLLLCVGNNSSQGHSHYDQNSFVLALNGQWAFTDPGYQDYGGGAKSDYTLSYGHSTLWVDGKTQSVKGGSALRTMLDSAAYSALIGSAAGAYGDPALTRFDRNYIMVNYGDTPYYVLIDHIGAESAHTYSWVLNAEGLSGVKIRSDGGFDPLASGGTMRTDEFYAVGKSNAFRVAFDAKYDISYGKWENQGALITVTGGKTRAETFCAVLSPLEGKGVSSLTAEKTVSVLQSYTDETQTGVMTQHGELKDIIIVSASQGVSADGLAGNGQSASIFGLAASGLYQGYAATETTELTYGGKILLQADAPVSASVFFNGGESVLRGNAGTNVRVFAPNGIGETKPDGDGYCTLTLTAERMTVAVNEGNSETPVTTEPSTEKTKKGCLSTVSVLPILLTAFAALPMTAKKKKKH